MLYHNKEYRDSIVKVECNLVFVRRSECGWAYDDKVHSGNDIYDYKHVIKVYREWEEPDNFLFWKGTQTKSKTEKYIYEFIRTGSLDKGEFTVNMDDYTVHPDFVEHKALLEKYISDDWILVE